MFILATLFTIDDDTA